jgi:plastocyanin
MRRSRLAPFVLSLVSVLALSLALTACGGDDDATPSRHPMGSMPGDHMGEGPQGHRRSTPVAEGARRIEVRATSFSFDPDVIRVAAGEDVAIVLRSEDVLHDLTVDELDVHVAAGRGEVAEGGLRAGEPGEYVFYCTVPGHRAAGMEGTLVVGTS